jgi:anti-sigma regulatory factor (Ser/Thr protein kinase)
MTKVHHDDRGPSQVHGSEVDERCARFEPEASSIRRAREFVRQSLQHCRSSPLDGVLLVTSELATNAVKHVGTDFEVRTTVRWQGSDIALRVEVRDPGASAVAREDPSDDAEAGRGLQIVEHECDRWGDEPGADGRGKVVFAEFQWFEPDPANVTLPSDCIQNEAKGATAVHTDQERALRRERVTAAKDALTRSATLNGAHVAPARAALRDYLRNLNDPQQPNDAMFQLLIEAPFREPRPRRER